MKRILFVLILLVPVLGWGAEHPKNGYGEATIKVQDAIIRQFKIDSMIQEFGEKELSWVRDVIGDTTSAALIATAKTLVDQKVTIKGIKTPVLPGTKSEISASRDDVKLLIKYEF